MRENQHPDWSILDERTSRLVIYNFDEYFCVDRSNKPSRISNCKPSPRPVNPSSCWLPDGEWGPGLGPESPIMRCSLNRNLSNAGKLNGGNWSLFAAGDRGLPHVGSFHLFINFNTINDISTSKRPVGCPYVYNGNRRNPQFCQILMSVVRLLAWCGPQSLLMELE